MDVYSQFLHKSRYARYVDKNKRREHWEETVQRFVDFMQMHLKENLFSVHAMHFLEMQWSCCNLPLPYF